MAHLLHRHILAVLTAITLGIGSWGSVSAEPSTPPADSPPQSLIGSFGVVVQGAAQDVVGAVASVPGAVSETASTLLAERSEVIFRAMSLLGVSYRFGGTSPDTGLDCSGLVQTVFRDALGLVLPRRAIEMSQIGQSVNREGLKPGDLVFFNTLRRTFSHVGIYIGDNKFVHAPSSGGKVRVEQLSDAYWRDRFNGARRFDSILETRTTVSWRPLNLPTASALTAGPDAVTPSPVVQAMPIRPVAIPREPVRPSPRQTHRRPPVRGSAR